MSNATACKLPPEITDRIIDFLCSDKTALSACSLVCKSWLPASRHYLFERLTLSPAGDVERFQEPLDRSVISTIAPYVRHFNILENSRRQWVNSAAPPFKLADFKDVKSLLLSNMHYDSDPQETLRALGASFPGLTLLRLDTVVFDHFNRVLEFICMFPMLEEVHLENVRVKVSDENAPTFEPPPDNPLPHLRSLRLGNKDILVGLWNWCRFYGRSPSIDRLFLVAHRGEVLAIAELLRDLGSSLKHLELGFEIDSMVEEDYAALDLQLNAELSAIHLLLPCSDAGASPIVVAAQVLSRIACPSLREVTLSLQLTLEQLTEGDAWSRLDEALVASELQGLQVMAFRLFDEHGCVIPVVRMDSAVTVATLRTWLPSCEARNVLLLV